MLMSILLCLKAKDVELSFLKNILNAESLKTLGLTAAVVDYKQETKRIQIQSRRIYQNLKMTIAR